MLRRLAERPGLVFAVVFAWKIALFIATVQPVPSNDAYFYDGAVVNVLNGGGYCNPSLALALPISGTEVFCAYPPAYQAVLWGWMSVFGTSEVAAMLLHLALFGAYLLVLLEVFHRLKTPPLWINLTGLFLFVITFHDRPDSLAQLLGISAVLAWVAARAAKSGSQTVELSSDGARTPSSARTHSSERADEGVRAPVFLGGWRDWLAAVLVILALCTSLQLGGVYLCLIWLLTILTRVFHTLPTERRSVTGFSHSELSKPVTDRRSVGLLVQAQDEKREFAVRTRKEPFPWAPLVATLLIPAALIALVKFGYPHLWAGFQEHARQTPSVLGWRWPRMDEGLKVLRTGPGVWGVAVAAILMGLRNRQRLTERLASLPALVALGGAAAVAGIVLAALIYLTPNFALSIGYLQPLVVGGFLTAYGGEWLARGQRRFLIWAFVLLAAVGAVRAVGMSTWGIACAVDVSHAQGMQRAREALDRTPAGTTVVVSAAFLYEAARHQDLRAIHSDWLAPGHHPEPLINLIIKHRPARLILTQFDYYRHFEGAVQQLQARDRQVEVKTDNAAKIRVPDASRQLQRVVQHISWAPVIVELNWH